MQITLKNFKLNFIKNFIKKNEFFIVGFSDQLNNEYNIFLKQNGFKILKLKKSLFGNVLNHSVYNYTSDLLFGSTTILHGKYFKRLNVLKKNNFLFIILKTNIYSSYQISRLQNLKFIKKILTFRNLLKLSFKSILFFQFRNNVI
jgi:hypothetical protein